MNKETNSESLTLLSAARAIAAKDDLCERWEKQNRVPCVASGCNCLRLGRAAIAAYKAALAKKGFVIARPHDWQPEEGWPYNSQARVICRRCGVNKKSLAVEFSCGSM